MYYDYDLFVIGAGSGGVRCARVSAQLGARVAIAEQQYLGGTCVNVGCVPKKLFTYAANFHQEYHAAKGFGWQVTRPEFDWATLVENKNREIERLNGIYQDLLENAGVELLNGRAIITAPNRVVLGDREYTARYILVATGSTPYVPEFPGNEYVITSNEAFYLDRLPEKIVIVGGGFIAVEFAGIFHQLGVETHLLYRRELFLRGFDDSLRENLKELYIKQGIHLHFNTDVKRIAKSDEGHLDIELNNGNQMRASLVMYATGRRPNTAALGVENTAARLADNGAIVVNDQFQSDDSHLYALGDVIDRLALTPVATAEAMVLADHLFGSKTKSMDYENIPSAVFSNPHIGTVGLTEAEARKNFGKEVAVYESNFRPMKETLGGGVNRVLTKLIVHTASDRVIGCHMLGDHAGEIIQGFAVAMRAGATKADFDNTVGIHPTAAEEFVVLREANQPGDQT